MTMLATLLTSRKYLVVLPPSLLCSLQLPRLLGLSCCSLWRNSLLMFCRPDLDHL